LIAKADSATYGMVGYGTIDFEQHFNVDMTLFEKKQLSICYSFILQSNIFPQI
jgi:hypothetical protein